MVELLVANGGSLNAKSVLDETPLGESFHRSVELIHVNVYVAFIISIV